jgi:hypothetical protein
MTAGAASDTANKPRAILPDLNLAKSSFQESESAQYLADLCRAPQRRLEKGRNGSCYPSFRGAAMVPFEFALLPVVSLAVIAAIVGIEWTIAWLILLGIASIAISFDAPDDYSRDEADRAAPYSRPAATPDIRPNGLDRIAWKSD